MARDSAGVGYDFYAGLTEGGPIAVRYVAGKPALNEVEAGWTFFGGMLLLGFGAIFAAVGGIGLWFRVRTVRRGGAVAQPWHGAQGDGDSAGAYQCDGQQPQAMADTLAR